MFLQKVQAKQSGPKGIRTKVRKKQPFEKGSSEADSAKRDTH